MMMDIMQCETQPAALWFLEENLMSDTNKQHLILHI